MKRSFSFVVSVLLIFMLCFSVIGRMAQAMAPKEEKEPAAASTPAPADKPTTAAPA